MDREEWGREERDLSRKLSWKAGAGHAGPRMPCQGLGFAPWELEGLEAMAWQHQVSGQWKHWKAGGRIKAEEGAIATVQAQNDGAGITDSTKASSSAAE